MITVIVLLILAGISLNYVLGNNGIIAKAEGAKTETEIASEKEKINLSAAAAQTSSDKGTISRDDLDAELKNQFGEDYILEPDDDAEEYEITCKKSGRKYIIKS